MKKQIVIGLVLLTATAATAATFHLNEKTAKTTIVGADIYGIEDSENSWNVKKVTHNSLKAFLDTYYPSKTNTAFLAGAWSDLKILDSAQPVNGQSILLDSMAYGNADDALHLWSIDKVGYELAGKQATLVSAINIKTVNSTSLLGSGDIAITPMTYPGAGIPNSSGSAWGTSYSLDTDLSSVSGSDDTIPSAKATKTALDLKAPAIAVEVDGSASATLTAAQMSNTIVSNYGQAASDVALGLPTALAGYAAVFTVGTAQTNKWGVQAGASDKIYLIAADGTISVGSDNGYARMTAAQVGQSFACWTFKTGASAWDWMCRAGAIGTSTFAAN